jgi:hypothetical protein
MSDDPKGYPRDKSEDGSETDTSTQRVNEPSQEELDADRAANPDTSEEKSKGIGDGAA